MERELLSAIENLTSEIRRLKDETEDLRKVNAEISEKLYLTNEYLSTR